MTDIAYYAMMRLSDSAVTWDDALREYLRENPGEIAGLFEYFRTDDHWPCDIDELRRNLDYMEPHDVYRLGNRSGIDALKGPYFTLEVLGSIHDPHGFDVLHAMSAEEYVRYCIEEICCEWDDYIIGDEYAVISPELMEIWRFWQPGGDKQAAQCLNGASFGSRNIKRGKRRSRL